MTHITPHTTPAQYRTAEFDPASKWLYYLTNAGGEFNRVKRYELLTGKHEDVEAADWDVVFTRFSHGGRYRVTAVNEDARTVIRLHDTTSGKLVPMPRLPEGDVTSVAISRDEVAHGDLAQRRSLAHQPLRRQDRRGRRNQADRLHEQGD